MKLALLSLTGLHATIVLALPASALTPKDLVTVLRPTEYKDSITEDKQIQVIDQLVETGKLPGIEKQREKMEDRFETAAKVDTVLQQLEEDKLVFDDGKFKLLDDLLQEALSVREGQLDELEAARSEAIFEEVWDRYGPELYMDYVEDALASLDEEAELAIIQEVARKVDEVIKTKSEKAEKKEKEATTPKPKEPKQPAKEPKQSIVKVNTLTTVAKNHVTDAISQIAAHATTPAKQEALSKALTVLSSLPSLPEDAQQKFAATTQIVQAVDAARGSAEAPLSAAQVLAVVRALQAKAQTPAEKAKILQAVEALLATARLSAADREAFVLAARIASRLLVQDALANSQAVEEAAAKVGEAVQEVAAVKENVEEPKVVKLIT